MNRRVFLQSGGAILALAKRSHGADARDGKNNWRIFEVVARIEVLKPAGPTRVWLPQPLMGETPFQKPVSDHMAAPGGTARILAAGKADSLGIATAEFPAGVRPVVTLTSRVMTKDYTIDLSVPGKAPNTDPAELKYFLRPTKLLPTDGVVKTTALQITAGAKTDIDKARAIYNWIVDNTFRDPKTRGCGVGDIRFMLQSRDLGGKCADINALYVGLARAAGLPARDAYGIRVAKSELGYGSLGAASQNITKAQHCRAEVYLRGYGWVPVDPADVRKVALEEPAMTGQARARLFGAWEMNWIAYNFAHDVELPDSAGKPLGFLMYPQAETADGRLDSLDPDGFSYQITSRELNA